MFSYSFIKCSILVVALSSLVLGQDIPPEDLPTLPTTTTIPTTTIITKIPEDVTPEASTESSSSTDSELSTWSSTSSSSTQQTTVFSSERPTSPEEDWKCQCWFQSKRTFYLRRACFLCCTSLNRRSCSMVSSFYCYGY